MNSRAMKSIIKKDITEVTKSTQMMFSMVVVPLLILIVIPALLISFPNFVDFPIGIDQFIQQMVQVMPGYVKSQVSGFGQEKLLIYLLVNYLFGPLFLIIPLMVSTIVAANSFAGEKENKTLEGLLFAPLTDSELFLSKAMAAFIPAILVAFTGFIMFTIVVDSLAYPTFGYILLPNTLWMILILWIVPTISFFGIGVTVIVSTKAKGFQEAQQISGVVILPIVALIIMEATGILFLSNKIVLLMGLIFFILDIILVRIGITLFKGEKIIERT